ncbi:MAG TPA: hypothetical protein P5509_04720 [Bacteroidales bacterium]|nr:hypothetical protein [Bacteroidales bacterium]
MYLESGFRLELPDVCYMRIARILSVRQRETGMKGLFVVMDIDLDLGLDID